MAALNKISHLSIWAATTRLARAMSGARMASTTALQDQPSSTSLANTPAKALQAVFDHEALIVTRKIEWGTVLLGFEQANKYTIYNKHGEVVALLAEDDSMLRTVGRQILSRHRPIKATVLSPDGQHILFRISRPAFLISSRANILDEDGDLLGDVFGRWHPLRRNYDLYVDKRQVAAIRGDFLAWEFQVTDDQGNVRALIDRNFQGLGKELFTDAGKYAIHFGSSAESSAAQVANTIRAAHPTAHVDEHKLVSSSSGTNMLLPTAKGDQLVVKRPMHLTERMAVLAAAISIDCDYFSRAGSWYGGWAHMLIPYPVPPVPVDGGLGDGVAGAAAASTSAESSTSSNVPPSSAPPSSTSDVPPSSSDSLDDEGFSPDSFDGELLDDEGGGTAGAAAATGGAIAAIADIFGL